jgi:DNA-binding SARP family transcriptional activator
VDLRLLGPVELHVSNGPVELGPPLQRCVLAALAADVGRPVPNQTLIDRVWGPDAPHGAQRSLYVYITKIRNVLAAADPATRRPVVRRSGGYLLDLAPDQVDLHRFRRLVTQARDPINPGSQRPALLRRAIDLCRGDPLADLPGDWPDRVRRGWSQEYLEAVTAWALATLSTGDGGAAISLLTDLIDRYPLNEALAAALVRALHAAGRSAEALDQYARLRARLADDLGTDPSTELQTLNQQILRGEPVAHPSAARSMRRAGTGVVPALLPADLASFAGRTRHVDQLDALLPGRSGAAPGTAVVITAIAGTAGVGKTALAVHWAHRVRDQFPDGQLYVNLRGFDPTGTVMEPAEAVRRFLDALQVPPQNIPAGLDAQLDLYRSLLADKQMLIVLDNARDTGQVRPLLPAAAGCFTVVTSRNQLTGLVAADGAHPVILDLLTDTEARELLTRRLGPDRVAGAPEATDQMISACARLPLALALVAARAAAHPHLRLTSLAGELRDSRARLDALTSDDPHVNVRAVLSWSYRALTPGAAELFRLLGLHPGPDLSVPAAASLAGVPADTVGPLLTELTTANLLAEHTTGRYTLHDLLRAYAAELAGTADSDRQRRAAIHRMLDHYLHTAQAADRLLYPNRDAIALPAPRPGVTPLRPTNDRLALDWFTTERAVLLAAVHHAHAAGFDTHTWQLAWTLATVLDRQGHWHDHAAVQHAAVAATQRLADPRAQAHAHRNLAHARAQLGHLDESHAHLRHALDLFRRTDDRAGQAQVHHNLANLWNRQGRHAEALDHARQALDLHRAAGHRVGQARALNGVGWYHILLGNHEQAIIYCQQALDLQQELGDRDGQAATRDSLGYAYHHLGQHAQALTYYQQAVELYRDLGDRYFEAATLIHLGDTHHAAGHPTTARDAWRHALTILTDLDHPDAAAVRTKLSDDEDSGLGR